MAGQRFSLTSKYDELSASIANLAKFFSDIGAMVHIEILNNDIPSLNKLLAKQDKKISLLIWNGLIQTGFQDGFNENSNFVRKLKDAEWVLGDDGDFYTPLIHLDELSEEFGYSEKNSGVMRLLKLLGFQTKNQKEAQDKAKQKEWEEKQLIRHKREEEKKRQQRVEKVHENGVCIALAEVTQVLSPEQQEELAAIGKQMIAQPKSNEPATSSLDIHDEEQDEEIVGNQPVNIHQEFDAAFNRSGNVQLSNNYNKESSPVNNPDQYRERAGEAYQQNKHIEPPRAERRQTVERDVYEAKNPENRGFFLEEYGGKCQICDYTFEERNGKPHFEVVYVTSYKKARWVDAPGNVLCLCAQCSAKYQYGAVELRNASKQLLTLQPKAESGSTPVLTIRLVGEVKVIKFSDRHLLQIQALLQTK